MIEKFDFDMLEWVETSPGILQKGYESEGKRYRIVEYRPNARHNEWCAREHRGIVLEGVIEFETPEERLQVKAGEAFWIEEGTPHRASNGSDRPSRFFLAD